MAVDYHILFWILPIVPTKLIQNILEWVNHRLLINEGAHVTEFQTSKTLLIRLPGFWRSVLLNE